MGNSLSFRQQSALQQAVGLHQNGRLAEAIDAYRKLLRAVPSNAEVLCLLGNAEHQSGNTEEGARLLGKSLLIMPKIPNTWFNRGTMLMELDRIEEALACYDKAVALKADFAEAWINRGSALQALDRPAEAVASYDHALALRSGYVQAWNNRGNALQDLGRHDEALASFERAVTLQPDYAVGQYNRASALQELGRLEEALAGFEAALRLEPDYAEAYNNSGNALRDLGRLDDALGGYEKALAVDPDIDWLMGHAQYVRMRLCDWTDFDRRLANLLAGTAAGARMINPFQLQALADVPELLLRAARLNAEANYPPRPQSHPPAAAHDRIRVAYVSTDFREHPVARLLAAVLEHHDRSQFEIFALSIGPAADDDLRRRVEAAVDHFIDVRDRSDAEIAQLGAELGIDIAVDLNGYTLNGRTGIFAGRLAPVQIGYVGYLGTMGAPYFDYLVADDVIIPHDKRAFYSEKIVSLPSFQANDDKLPPPGRTFSRAEAGLPDTGFVFCCFNQSYKITPEVFSLWMRLLDRVPDSVLWILADNPTSARNLKAEAEKRGTDPARLVFAETVPMADHFSRQALAGLFLDTAPYNAGATASAALRAGLPVLTRTGDSFAARMGTSLLHAVGVPELAVETWQDYEDMAVRLATEPDYMTGVRRKLADSLPTCPLFDTVAFTQSLEAAYTIMQQRQRDGLAPDHIRITA